MTAIGDLWRSIRQPSGDDETPYDWAVIAIGHVMVGAALASALGSLTGTLRLLVAWFYWISKERSDLRRGGGLRDGLVDTGFVYLGCYYDGSWWWPVSVLALVVVGVFIRPRLIG